MWSARFVTFACLRQNRSSPHVLRWQGSSQVWQGWSRPLTSSRLRCTSYRSRPRCGLSAHPWPSSSHAQQPFCLVPCLSMSARSIVVSPHPSAAVLPRRSRWPSCLSPSALYGLRAYRVDTRRQRSRTEQPALQRGRTPAPRQRAHTPPPDVPVPPHVGQGCTAPGRVPSPFCCTEFILTPVGARDSMASSTRRVQKLAVHTKKRSLERLRFLSDEGSGQFTEKLSESCPYRCHDLRAAQ